MDTDRGWWRHVNGANLMRLVSGCNYVHAILKPLLLAAALGFLPRYLIIEIAIERIVLARMLP